MHHTEWIDRAVDGDRDFPVHLSIPYIFIGANDDRAKGETPLFVTKYLRMPMTDLF
ncbi:hypothetical protein PMm318_A42340 [Pseudomonas moorei]